MPRDDNGISIDGAVDGRLADGIPSTIRFDRQDEAYRRSMGPEGACIGIDAFGESAPDDTLFDPCAVTAGAVAVVGVREHGTGASG